MSHAAAVEVQAIYRGVVIDTRYLCPAARRPRRRRPHQLKYVIGATRAACAPVPGEYTGGAAAWSLVQATEAGFWLNVTDAMTGTVGQASGASTPLSDWVHQHGGSFLLPAGGQARIECGAATFVINATSQPAVLPPPGHKLRWNEQKYTVGSSLTLMLLVLVTSLVPPDVKALSFDRYAAHLAFAPFVIAPAEVKPPPPLGPRGKADGAAGPSGQRHAGPSGAMGKTSARDQDRRHAVKGAPEVRDEHLARQRVDEIKRSGVLGLLQPAQGSVLASVFGRDTALGRNSEAVLGHLVGSQIGEAYAVGGLDIVGTGAGAAGTGQGTIGLGELGKIGVGDHGARGAGYGPGGTARLPGRRTVGPDFAGGQAVVRGALDKEIIRRIIRRHINEVRFCYERELLRNQHLSGRVAVNFTIAPNGLVAAAALQSTTIGNVRVEGCIVQAVRRWEFPKPEGGGVVIATYPFNFVAAGHAE